SVLTWPLDAAPTERERLRALAELAARDAQEADAIGRANGWARRLERARGAFNRPTRLTHPLLLEQLGSRGSFAVTELERFADCSSAWFVERFLDPKTIDAEPDAKQRGSVAHNALYRFFTRVPAELGVEKLEPQHVEAATGLMRRCLDESLAGVRMDLTEMQERELDQTLWRDLAAFVEEECESQLPLVPRRFEVSVGGERAAPSRRRCRATCRTTTSARRRSGASSSRRVRPRRRSPSGCGKATSATTRSAASARAGATSGPSAGSSDRERLRAERAAARGGRGGRGGLRLRRRRHRQDRRARRAGRPRGLRPRPRR